MATHGDFRRSNIELCGYLQLALMHHDELCAIVVQSDSQYSAALVEIETVVPGGPVAYISSRRQEIISLVDRASSYSDLRVALVQVDVINSNLRSMEASLSRAVRRTIADVSFADLDVKTRACEQLRIVDSRAYDDYAFDPVDRRSNTYADLKRFVASMAHSRVTSASAAAVFTQQHASGSAS